MVYGIAHDLDDFLLRHLALAWYLLGLFKLAPGRGRIVQFPSAWPRITSVRRMIPIDRQERKR